MKRKKKKKKKPHSKKVELCHWVVAFMDLLGQGDKMKDVSRLLDEGKEEDAVSRMKQIYADHSNFYDAFQKTILQDNSHPIHPPIPLPPGITLKEYQKIFRTNLKLQTFSDSIMIYLPLADNGANLPMYGISLMLSALGIQMLSFLAQKKPFRCGVEVGFGIEIESGKLIGPAVQNAYELESKQAQYPRIVLGKDLEIYLKGVAKDGLKNCTPEQNSASKTMAKRCLSWMGTDIDGETILNYLSPKFLEKLPKDKTEKIISLAHDFTNQEQARHRKDKNSKLAIRYACLETFFRSQIKSK